MRNTILSISAFGLAAIAAGYTFATNPPDFFQQKVAASEPVRSTYSFGTKLTSGNFYADKTSLSYDDCQGMLQEEASGTPRSSLNYVCTPEDGDGLTFSLAMKTLNKDGTTFSDALSTLSEGMTRRDCDTKRGEMNNQAIEYNPSFVDVFRCVPELGTAYSTSLTWRLVSEAGHTSALGTRSDCEANLAILDQARLEGRGSGLTYSCVEVP